MLLLLFTIGEERYGVEATQVQEVWPLLPLKPVHRVPDYIVGLISSRGEIVPVVDISRLYVNKSASNLISTRVIVIKVSGQNGEEHKLGILAEHVTDTIKIEVPATKSFSIKSKNDTLVGEELLVNDQLIHKINVNDLIQKDLYEQVFCHNYES